MFVLSECKYLNIFFTIPHLLSLLLQTQGTVEGKGNDFQRLKSKTELTFPALAPISDFKLEKD